MAAAIPYAIAAVSAYGSYSSSKAQSEASRAQGRQLETNSQKIYEMGKFQANEVQRQGRVTMSDAQARQAASGFSASDPASLKQLAEIAGQAKFNELAVLYESNARAQGEVNAAQNVRRTGAAVKSAGALNAVTSAVSAYAGAGGSFGG